MLSVALHDVNKYTEFDKEYENNLKIIKYQAYHYYDLFQSVEKSLV